MTLNVFSPFCLIDNAYLNWRPRQYIFEGAEVDYDPDDDDNDDDDSSSSSGSGSDSETSTSSSSGGDNRESTTDMDSRSATGFEIKKSITQTQPTKKTVTKIIKSNETTLVDCTESEETNLVLDKLLESESTTTTTSTATTTIVTSISSAPSTVNTKDD